MKRLNLLVLLAVLSLGACQTAGTGPQGDAVTLARDAMVVSAREAAGPIDASAAAAAVGALRGDDAEGLSAVLGG